MNFLLVPRLSRLLAAAVLAAGLLAAPAVQAEQGEIIKSLSIADTERLLQALKVDYTEKSEGVYLFQLKGYKCLLYNKGKNLQFYAGFKMRRPVTLGRINEWNKTKRYSRAYIDKEGDPVIEMDLDLEGGVAYGAVGEFIRTWMLTVDQFTQHIDFNK